MKKENEIKFMRKQISRKLETFKESLPMGLVATNWSRYIRKALGMSAIQLAERLNITQSTLSGLEKREELGSITMKKLKELANAMECDVVYSFVPRKPIEQIIQDQAKKKAIESIKLSDTHMDLENQKVRTSYDERLEDLIEEKKYSKYLWDTNE